MAETVLPDIDPLEAELAGEERMMRMRALDAAREEEMVDLPSQEPEPVDALVVIEGAPEEETEEEAEAPPLEGIDLLRFFAEVKEVTGQFDDDQISKLGQVCKRGYDMDNESRKEWLDELKEIRDLAAQRSEEEKTYPFVGASDIKFPILSQIALEFNARAYPALLNDGNVVKGKVSGNDEDGSKNARKERVEKWMSYEAMELIPDWEDNTDRLILAVPTDGVAFKKVYFDPVLGENRSDFVPADDLTVNMATAGLRTCPRISQDIAFYPYEIDEFMGAGIWREVSLDVAEPEVQTPEDFVEQHILYDLDDDGYAEPYIVTFQKDTGTVVRIVANFRADNIVQNDAEEVIKVVPQAYFIKYECFSDPEGGFYGRGFGSLLRSTSHTINSILNQMIDAGHLHNTGGGFLGSGFRTEGGSIYVGPGEWKKVPVTGGSLRDNIFPLPGREPSLVLFQLMGTLIEAAKGLGSVQDVMTGGGGQNMPATSVMAMIEQGTKVYTSIVKRLFRSMKEEFNLLYDLNGIYLDEARYREFLEDEQASIADFENGTLEVSPQADPRMATDMQKMAKIQLLREDLGLPWVNGPEITLEGWKLAGIDEPERFMAPPPKPQPPTPEQLERLAEIEIKRKDSDTKRMEAVGKVILDIAKADETGQNDLMNIMQVIIAGGRLEDAFAAQNERAEESAPGAAHPGPGPTSGVPPSGPGGAPMPPQGAV